MEMTAEIKKYSDAELQKIQEEFKRRHKKQWLLMGGLAVCVACILWACWFIAELGMILDENIMFALLLIVALPFVWAGDNKLELPGL